MKASSIRQAKRIRNGSVRQIKSAQAAGRGTKQKRNSADLAAAGESVVRALTRTTGRRLLKHRSHMALMKSKWNRRRFLASTAAAGAALALSSRPVQAQKDGIELRTLFFNFTHLGPRRSSFRAVIGGTVYTLSPVHDRHPALLKARQTNSVVRQIPPSLLTHVLEDVPLPAAQVATHYTLTDADPATGTWSMPSMFMTIPKSALAHAFQVRTTLLGDAPVPVSAKRELYGLGPAMTLQELMDEQDVVDVTDQASAMILSHPEILSIDAPSAADIHTNHVAATVPTKILARNISSLGAATPAQTAGHTNPKGWASLVPLKDDDGTVLKFKDPAMADLNLYTPIWNPKLTSYYSQAVAHSVSTVKNAPGLGADITGSIAQAETTDALLTSSDFTGKIWSRRDGVTSIAQSGQNLSAADAAKLVLVSTNPRAGYDLTADISQGSGNATNITLHAVNSYLRWLGVYIRFFDGTGKAVPIDSLPQGISAEPALDLADAAFLGAITPEFTIFGIPVQSSKLSPRFPFPLGVASSAEVLASGIGAGSSYYQATEPVGIVLTSFLNFFLPAFLLALARPQILGPLMAIIGPSVSLVILEANLLFTQVQGDKLSMFMVYWRIIVRGAVSGVLTGLSKFITALLDGIATLSVGATVINAFPIVGQIFQAIAALGVAAELIETGVEVGLSPKTYRHTIQFTHDFPVTIQHATGNDRFPETATTYTVTAIFDQGKPYQVLGTLPAGTVTTLPPTIFTGVPLGGKVNIVTAFYAANGWQAGQGQTGSIDNQLNIAPAITLTQNVVPIGPSTRYMHDQKTVLDAQGRHVWQPGPAPASRTAPTGCENNPVNLCDFRKITVRQGSSTSPGYVGYGWKAYSTVDGCASGGQGQLDLMANLPTSGDAQMGYATLPCGLGSGSKLAYNLQSKGAANYYLDSNSNLVRQVQLDPPMFADPRANQAWAKLNLDSTDLLLHPGGRLISINGVNSKMESLLLPPSAMPDPDAAVHLQAELYSGRGSRPGRMDTPTAAAISAQGVVLVLEAGNNRIQALDTSSNPVPLFSKLSTPYYLQFSATSNTTSTYLDLAVELSGYIYVLSNTSSGIYRLDIYHQDQSDTNPISTTMNVNAARLAVDLWRNVYTLNYEVLKLPNGTYPAITEPSVSLWVPSAPSASIASLAARPLRRRCFLPKTGSRA